MQRILGLIGSGNMGQAIIGGIIKAKCFLPENIFASDVNEKTLISVSEKYGIQTTTDNCEVARAADILILSVKPHLYPAVIHQIRDQIKENAIIVTIAAGKGIRETEEAFGRKIKVARVMPNTPALVGEGMTALCPNDMLTEEEKEEIIRLFESIGKVEVVPENLMDAVTAVSGSSPAYVYLVIEAMADAAVLAGMPRDQAYRMASQAVLGAAKMVLETGMHPGALKDMVCSPGGTTIEAVAVLEEKGLRSAIISAIKACVDKSIAMTSQK
ncbi:MAG TPA: pyrroline-5-carboxylate reductase [Clostridiales bacterium]|nr:pyrroline-5-carboxylate reductase [Clostridiales bacterium]